MQIRLLRGPDFFFTVPFLLMKRNSAKGPIPVASFRCAFLLPSVHTYCPYLAGIPSSGIEFSMKERIWSFAVPRSSSRRYIMCPLR